MNLFRFSLPLAFFAVIFFIPCPWEKNEQIGGFEPVFTNDSPEISTETYTRQTISFPSPSHGASSSFNCSGWLFLPKSHPDTRERVIVMAHGLGAQIDFGLTRYAEVFVKRGFAVLMFDYRNWGESDGALRHVVDPSMQLEDWRAALSFARNDLHYDKIGIWGTSFSGGHVLTLSSEGNVSKHVSAVVSQMPFLKVKPGASTARVQWAVVRDLARQALHLKPLYIPLVSREHQLGVMRLSAEDYAAYFRKHAPVLRGGWRNLIAARSLFKIMRYRPIDTLGAVKTPVLLVSATDDALCPLATIHEAQVVMDTAQLLTQKGSHFTLYLQGVFEPIAEQMADFFEAHFAE
eukprot:gnl/Trimastix_PCT/3732.p1 GENE.gnl/Trimastix_PCT/3732~~gnl/Trimastix_PCT/3732.p1  ORF type:complete len:348 (+),score=60.47 gnl/Trimastix_PCT/3732:46-1089(+)